MERKFIFRCEECSIIIEIIIDDPTILAEIEDDDYVLECQCGGLAEILWN